MLKETHFSSNIWPSDRFRNDISLFHRLMVLKKGNENPACIKSAKWAGLKNLWARPGIEIKLIKWASKK